MLRSPVGVGERIHRIARSDDVIAETVGRNAVQLLLVLFQFGEILGVAGLAHLLFPYQQRAADRQVRRIEILVILQQRLDRNAVALRNGVERLVRLHRMQNELFAEFLLLSGRERRFVGLHLRGGNRNFDVLVGFQHVGHRRIVRHERLLAHAV